MAARQTDDYFQASTLRLMGPGRTLPLALLALSLAGCGHLVQSPAAAPSAPRLHSVEQADHALAEAAAERTAFEGHFLERERVCYTKFFVNACLDEARERRRVALAKVRAVEVEAGRYKRQAAVDERDSALAAAEKDEQEREAARAVQEATVPVALPAPAPAPARVTLIPKPATSRRAPPKPVNRVAQHAIRVREQAAQDEAGAGKRAANVSAFEKKKLASEQRTREVAARLAEKEAEKKAQADKGEQAKPAPAIK